MREIEKYYQEVPICSGFLTGLYQHLYRQGVQALKNGKTPAEFGTDIRACLCAQRLKRLADVRVWAQSPVWREVPNSRVGETGRTWGCFRAETDVTAVSEDGDVITVSTEYDARYVWDPRLAYVAVRDGKAYRRVANRVFSDGAPEFTVRRKEWSFASFSTFEVAGGMDFTFTSLL